MMINLPCQYLMAVSVLVLGPLLVLHDTYTNAQNLQELKTTSRTRTKHYKHLLTKPMSNNDAIHAVYWNTLDYSHQKISSITSPTLVAHSDYIESD